MLPGFPAMSAGAAPAPSVAGRTTGTFAYSSGRASVTIANTVAIGELVVVILSSYQNKVVRTFSSGWTKATEYNSGQGSIAVFRQVATSTASSLTVDFGSGIADHLMAWQCVRAAGANQFACSTSWYYTTGTADSDPPALTLSQARNALWVVVLSAYGTNWGLPSGSGYASWLFSAASAWNVGTAFKQAFKTSDDPGIITNNDPQNTDQWSITFALWKG